MKIFGILLISALTTICSASSSWAGDFDITDAYVTREPFLVPVLTPFPHNEISDEGPVALFGWDEQPWAAVKGHITYDTDGRTDWTFTTHWKYQNADNDWGLYQSNAWSFTSGSEDKTFHLEMKNDTWLDHRQAGDWAVNIQWGFKDSPVLLNEDRFFQIAAPTVTLEPASMALFGLGAGALALVRRRKK